VKINAGVHSEEGFDFSWRPPKDWINYRENNFFDASIKSLEHYLDSIYHAVLMLGYNEMGPVNEVELLYVIGSMLLASFLNA